MKEKNNPDNLEQFFQQSLRNYEEDPGKEFWDKIVPVIPTKPVVESKPFYRGWMILAAFIGGILLSSLFFFWHSNNAYISKLEIEVNKRTQTISTLEQQVIQLQQTIITKDQELIKASLVKTKNKLQEGKASPENLFSSSVTSKKAIAISPTKNKSFIKPEIARTKSVVVTNSAKDISVLQPFSTNFKTARPLLLNQYSASFLNYKSTLLLTDYQLISNHFFNREMERFITPEVKKIDRIADFDEIPSDKVFSIRFDKDYHLINWAEVKNTHPTSNTKGLDIDDDGLTSFIIASFNPISNLKYQLNGYRPNITISEVAGVKSALNWSITSGIETKTNWSFQIGLDFNELVLGKQSINNVRFKANELPLVNGNYTFSFNQITDGALGAVTINSQLLNQIRNDGEDVLDGDLFQLVVNTNQPLRIVRMPIMGGYKFQLNSRWYLTPKVGLAAVWSIKEQTELGDIHTLNERLSIQRSDIFLTNKVTRELLEGVFRAELGYRWRKKWFLVAEPRFKYRTKPLFTFKGVALEDAPFQVLLGIRYNID